jgi:hypothetical protein
MVARPALVLGGLVAALLTPPFALSYFLAYALPEESPPRWLTSLQPMLIDVGLLDVGSTAAYDRYGLLYWGAWVMALGGLVALLRRRRSVTTERVRRAWTVVVVGLGVVGLGILGDYAPTSDIIGGLGFVMTGLGFLVAAVGSGLLGWALGRDGAVNSLQAVGVAFLGVVSMVGGMALVAHIPSGPGLGWAAAAVVLGLIGWGPRPKGAPARGKAELR